ncbi:MAG: hypothetical protein V7K26_31015 [Nostoc sp.]|uniref:hypothetical protein n=1 Tax=Nostoc sp. TaxID=1180 RepID=UPI002FF3DF4A
MHSKLVLDLTISFIAPASTGDRYSPINHLQNITPKVVKPKSCFLDFDLFSDRTQAVIIAVKRGIVNL